MSDEQGHESNPSVHLSQATNNNNSKLRRGNISSLAKEYVANFKKWTSTVEYSAIPEFLQQKNANEFVNEVKCSVGSILKNSSIADFQKWKLIIG